MRAAEPPPSILLLGPVGVDVPGGRYGGLPAQLRKVLAVLAVNRGVALSGEQIVRRVWGQAPPESALQMVRNQIRALRHLFGRSERDVVERAQSGYRLTTAGLVIDAEEFQALVRVGREHLLAGRAVPAVHALRSALALWRGPEALTDVRDVPELELEAVRLEELRFQAEELIVDGHLVLGRPEEALPILRAMTTLYPSREPAWLRLMAAQTLAGRRAEASMETYRQAWHHLVEQTGLDAPLLTRVHQALLCGADGRDILAMITKNTR